MAPANLPLCWRRRCQFLRTQREDGRENLGDPVRHKARLLIWSSPAVYNGSVYIGLSSRGDCPLVRGELADGCGNGRDPAHFLYSAK